MDYSKHDITSALHYNLCIIKMSKRKIKTFREEQKELERNRCEFYRDYKRCYFKDLEFCRHEGNKNVCDIYRIEVLHNEKGRSL